MPRVCSASPTISTAGPPPSRAGSASASPSARAMVRDPAAFLFDEPLSNLDAQLRAQMRIEIKALHHRLGSTIAYVTHDQVEAMTMADRIVVMRDGHILQTGTPMDIYANPVDVFTARFIGTPSMNILPARENGDGLTADPGGRLLLGVRPQDLLIGGATGNAAEPGALSLSGPVTAVEPLGPETLVHFEIAGQTLIGTAPPRDIPGIGATVTATADPLRLHRFDAESEKALEAR